jgi:CheY-like chemotaxis protein
VGASFLLVHDDLATIALVRRTLVRAGHMVELATSTADALTSASTLDPALVLLAPGVEGGRGPGLLAELLRAHRRVLLLGRGVEGYDVPVLATPFRAETLLQAVDGALAAPAPLDESEPVSDFYEVGPAEAGMGMPHSAETVDLDWTPGPAGSVAESIPVSELTRDYAAVPLPSFGESAPAEAFDAGPLLEAALEKEPPTAAAEHPSAEDGQVVEATEEMVVTEAVFSPEALRPAPEPPQAPLAGDDSPPDAVLEGYDGTGEFVLAPPVTPVPSPSPVEAQPTEGGGLSEFARSLEAAPGGELSADSEPMLEVAAGAWTAATDHQLAPRGRGSNTASLLEDIAAEARAREEETRQARDTAVTEQRRRVAAEAVAESKAREARDSSAAALAARIDAEEARAQAESARAAREVADAARAEIERELVTRRLAEEEERRRRTEAEARAEQEAAEARRLEAAARVAQATAEAERVRAEEARAAAHAAQAIGAAEAELLATALREEAGLRAAELEEQVRLREEAERRAEAEALARLEAESRALSELSRLNDAVRALEEEATRARAEAEGWAEREREATRAAQLATEASRSLELEAAELARRLATEQQMGLENLRRSEAELQAEREAVGTLRRELAEAWAEAGRVQAALVEAHRRAVEAESRAAQEESARQNAQAEAQEREELALRARDEAERARWEAEERLRAEEERREREARVQAEVEAAEMARREAERARWAVADAGRVTLEELAALLFKLEEGRATARLELRSADALRVVWVEEGAVAVAASTVSTESLLDLALRDGLLDAGAERELRLLRLPDSELLEELGRRRLVTDTELVSFVQRSTESRALEAFSEPVSFYRLSPDTPPPDGRRAAVRSLSALAAEGLKRGLPPDDVERLVPSLRAVPVLLRRVDPLALGLGDRDRRLLDALDGQRTVQQLLLAAGVGAEAGRKAIAVAVALGWAELRAPTEAEAQAESAEVALARLEARWSQAEEADYFAVLGLPRSAGSDEVTRAFARLSAEYDPLRWSGHPDPRVQARAERLQTLLAEAARALSDDTLRTAYARSLAESSASGGRR